MKDTTAKHSDIQALNTPVVIECFLQDKGLEYAESLDFDNMKEQGIAYSSFVNACKFIVANKDKIDSLNVC